MHSARVPELNKVLLAGRLVRDPELRFSPKGVGVTNFTLAVNRRLQDAQGEWTEETTYVPVCVFGRTAEVVREHLASGSAVLVEGRLHGRSWTSPDGKPRRVMEVRADRVQFLDARDRGTHEAAPGGTVVEPATGPAGGGSETTHYIEGDLPF